MTTPGGDVGDVYAELHLRTDEVKPELKHALKQAGEDAEAEQTGKKIGDSVADGMETSVRRSRPRMKKAMEDATADWEEIPKQRVRRIARYFRDTASGEVRIKYFLEQVADDAYNAVHSGRAGKKFRRAGEAIGQDVGQGFGNTLRQIAGSVFNISGEGPLGLLLIPVLGFVAHAIASLLPAAYALTGLLYTMPALIGSIAAEVGVLMLAFRGVGTAIKAAFAATNAKELNEAVKNLTPSAQNFVRQLVTLKGLFSDLKRLAQESFFQTFRSSTLTELFHVLEPVLRRNIPILASALGDFLRQLVLVFESPAFIKFVDTVIPATAKFLQQFGPSLDTLITGMIRLATFMMPLLNHFGKGFTDMLDRIGKYFTNLSSGDRGQKFLDTATKLLDLTFQALGALLEFIVVFVQTFSEVAGEEVLKSFILFMRMMTAFLQSDVGRKALEGLAMLIIGLSGLFTLLFIVLGVLAAVTAVIIESLGQFLMFVMKLAWAFQTMLLIAIEMVNSKLDRFRALWETIKIAFDRVKQVIMEFFKNPGQMLYEAGRQIIEGLINGIKSKLGPLGVVMDGVMQVIRARMPGSPAKTGPLSGEGYTYLRGKALVDDFSRGISSREESLAQVSNQTMGSIIFGPGSVRVDMQGQVTPDQARITGTAVGMGALDAITRRNTQLAVRAL